MTGASRYDDADGDGFTNYTEWMALYDCGPSDFYERVLNYMAQANDPLSLPVAPDGAAVSVRVDVVGPGAVSPGAGLYTNLPKFRAEASCDTSQAVEDLDDDCFNTFTLTATWDQGTMVFLGWGGDDAVPDTVPDEEASYTAAAHIVLRKDSRVTAHFAPRSTTDVTNGQLTVLADEYGHGSVQRQTASGTWETLTPGSYVYPVGDGGCRRGLCILVLGVVRIQWRFGDSGHGHLDIEPGESDNGVRLFPGYKRRFESASDDVRSGDRRHGAAAGHQRPDRERTAHQGVRGAWVSFRPLGRPGGGCVVRRNHDFRQRRSRDLRQIAIDEICIGSGHNYVTVVLDLLSGAVVHVGDGKGGDALKPFWKRLRGAHAKIEAVAMDMSPAFLAAVVKHLPKAAIVFDHFHAIKLYQEKLSELRRDLYREATELLHKKVLKGTRWLLLKNPDHLDESKDEPRRLREALALNEPLALAYYMKEDLRRIWHQASKRAAKRLLTDWICFWNRHAQQVRQDIGNGSQSNSGVLRLPDLHGTTGGNEQQNPCVAA